MRTPDVHSSEDNVLANPLSIRFNDTNPDADGADGQAEVQFVPNSKSDMIVNVRMRLGSIRVCNDPLDISFSTMCYGYDLAAFAESLRNVHHRYDGSAQFCNTLEDLEVVLSLRDKGRGTVSVSMTYKHPGTDAFSPTEIKAGDFWVNQSLLRKIASDIQAYLNETGISTKHPMMDL